jgi:hypothetical protein
MMMMMISLFMFALVTLSVFMVSNASYWIVLWPKSLALLLLSIFYYWFKFFFAQTNSNLDIQRWSRRARTIANMFGD